MRIGHLGDVRCEDVVAAIEVIGEACRRGMSVDAKRQPTAASAARQAASAARRATVAAGA